MRGAYGWWSFDPGPCPVDDTPHTACTPESVALQSRSPQTCTVVITPPRVFSTGTYRRAVHGPQAVAVPPHTPTPQPPPSPRPPASPPPPPARPPQPSPRRKRDEDDEDENDLPTTRRARTR
jgi:hypothetical protein